MPQQTMFNVSEQYEEIVYMKHIILFRTEYNHIHQYYGSDRSDANNFPSNKYMKHTVHVIIRIKNINRKIQYKTRNDSKPPQTSSKLLKNIFIWCHGMYK